MQAIHLCRTIDPATLIHRYVTMAKPNLDSHHVTREIYARALARVSFVDAWLFQRSYADGQEDETRESLVIAILNTILMRESHRH
jgi:predicted NAD/FAD-binding protein